MAVRCRPHKGTSSGRFVKSVKQALKTMECVRWKVSYSEVVKFFLLTHKMTPQTTMGGGSDCADQIGFTEAKQESSHP